MNPTITCHYCGSADVPDDLVCIRTCEWCCSTSAELLVEGRGRLSTWITKRVLRRQRELREYLAWEDAEMRAAIEGR